MIFDDEDEPEQKGSRAFLGLVIAGFALAVGIVVELVFLILKG